MNQQVIKYILFLFLTISINSFASTTTAMVSASEEWNDAASWDNGIPGCFDSIIIPTGIFIEVSTMVNLTDCGPIVIVVEGELHFQNGKKLTLPAGSSIDVPTGGSITGGGGGGSSSYIQIGSETVWAASDGDLTGPIELCPSCALSIELDYYKIDQSESEVILIWGTISEHENSHFIVERKVDDQPWLFFAMIDGSGTTTENVSYQINDTERHEERVYYRLTQYDYNLSSEILGIRTANFANDVTVESAHSFDGRKVSSDQEGFVIVRYSDGRSEIIFK
jgi:hypothetical protein